MTFVIDNAYEFLRIDKFLAMHYSSRSYVQQMIKNGFVFVNDKCVKQNYVLKLNDVVITKEGFTKPECDLLPENIPLNIVYEDDDVIVINKPQGLVVHPGSGNHSGTLANALLYHCKSLSCIDETRMGIVHRIDKNTSGLIIAAKNNEAHVHLAKQFAEHSIIREYTAIVHGKFKTHEGIVNKHIKRHPKDRKRMCVTNGLGRHAITHYKVVEEFDKYTMIKAKLETGRTHQIRVHLSSINHPLLGDAVYGGKENEFGLMGQALTANVLGFIHPVLKTPMKFEIDLPIWFSDVLVKLRKRRG